MRDLKAHWRPGMISIVGLRQLSAKISLHLSLSIDYLYRTYYSSPKLLLIDLGREMSE